MSATVDIDPDCPCHDPWIVWMMIDVVDPHYRHPYPWTYRDGVLCRGCQHTCNREVPEGIEWSLRLSVSL